MAVIVKNKKGKEIVLLNPSEKWRKYASELRSNTRKTNSGFPKTDKYGLNQELTKEQRSYRAGYLSAQSDSADAYCHNMGIVPAKKRKKIEEDNFFKSRGK